MTKRSFKDGELQERYGQSKDGNFFVKDTIGVPHPYMITPGHVVVASDHYSGMLGESAIEAAEKKSVFCGICRGQLSFRQHETALLVSCKSHLKVGDQVNSELETYLKSIVDKCEEDSFAGFVFIRE